MKLSRFFCFALTFLVVGWVQSQVPFYEFRNLNFSLSVPKGINSTKSAVIITVPDEKIGEEWRVGEWKPIAEEAHKGFRIMGIDALFYLNDHDLLASNNSIDFYTETFIQRGIKNIIFITESKSKYDLMVVPFSGDNDLITSGSNAFRTTKVSLKEALISLGKEIKRSEMTLGNFLIPEGANYLSAASIIETERSERYPGQMRRNKIVIEKFEKLEMPKILSDESRALIEAYNKEMEDRNRLLDTLLQSYPYEYEIIDRMSNVELVRNRYQFVLRSVYGANSTLREMLEFEIGKETYSSTIPIMPDQSKTIEISEKTLVYKFFIRNNISTVIYTGTWDAHTDWKTALTNFLNNAVQSINDTRR